VNPQAKIAGAFAGVESVVRLDVQNSIGRHATLSRNTAAFDYGSTQRTTPVVQKKPSEIVWLPLASVDKTSNW
jgi:hypothetical protein